MLRIYPVLFLLFLLISCDTKTTTSIQEQGTTVTDSLLAKKSIALYLGLDTLAVQDRKGVIEEVLGSTDVSLMHSPYGFYFQSLCFQYTQQQDSSDIYFRKAYDAYSVVDPIWQRLLTYTQLGQELQHQRVAKVELMELLYEQLELVNQHSTILDYQLYDLLAKAYFLNGNMERSLHFTTRYYAQHPFKDNRRVKTRFYDISFLLAAELQDKDQAKAALQQLKVLLKDSKEETAIARYYDMEARYFALIGHFDEALQSSKRYFHYNKKRKQLHPTVYNNLATSFERNQQLDSAIHYYKEGIALAQQMKILEQNQLYGGLSQVYKRKGDYQQALIALDSSFAHSTRIKEKRNASKLHELELQYQTKQKDVEISSLKENYQLQRQTFVQQRWIISLIVLFVIGVLSYSLILYRQRLLSEKNKGLAIQNKKMELEQRLLQVQLNPHFIYNAIANLQGFINQEDKVKANRYLISLSKMIRNILELNRRDFVPLSEDLSAIENYLQVQQMRYNHSFDYHLVDRLQEASIEAEEILIPPMLLQPFIENAIEHGFKNITYQGVLTLTIEVKNEQLLLYIRDNGCGLQPKEKEETTTTTTTTTNKQSLAQIITQERLDALFHAKKEEAFFRLYSIEEEKEEEPSSSGVEVLLCIPLIYA
ncbi:MULTISPECIES: tetratricopeptide repeat-containing sensor histidine kinase [unclassified Myroides]|uniref:tetratricopeptide repeat-containing sensor histidine kinase n=1 Tax=unclassified Myroides TaxID=2642485 RepID=UPI003D2F6CE3